MLPCLHILATSPSGSYRVALSFKATMAGHHAAPYGIYLGIVILLRAVRHSDAAVLHKQTAAEIQADPLVDKRQTKLVTFYVAYQQLAVMKPSGALRPCTCCQQSHYWDWIFC